MSWQPPGAPQQPDPTTWTAGMDVLAAHSQDEPPARKAPWLLVAGVAALVLALVGGVTYGFGQLSGGGSQPEDALPAGAFGFVKVDLDPSAGQKIDGFRFLRKFPALRDRLGVGDDLRQLVFEAVADGAGWSDVDFDSEVAPWMGKRIGLATYAPASTDGPPAPPNALVALQVTDAGAAKTGLERLIRTATGGADDGTPAGFVVVGDYALLAETQQLADRAAADAENGVLASDDNLSADLAAAGDGVMAAWLDMDGAVAAMGAAAMGFGGITGLPGTVGGATGRSTYVARFDGPDVFEVAGSVIGSDTTGWATHPVEGLAELPASSVVAFGLADGDELVGRMYESLRTAFDSNGEGQGPSFDRMVAEAERELGIEVPDDLAALLGDNLVAALDGASSQDVQVGAKVRTDVPRAERVLDLLEKRGGSDFVVVRKTVGEHLVVASSPRQAARMAETGTLGEQPGFGAALPDLDEADMALWVDVNGVFGALFGALGGGEPDENLEPIDGVGVTVSARDGDAGTFRIRLVAH